MKQMLKLGFTLAAYAVISCLLLAVVNNFTSPVIEQHLAEKTAAGMKQVFPDADSFTQVTDFTEPEGAVSIDAMYIAEKDGVITGAVTKATGPTYDVSTMLIGQDVNGIITGVRFITIGDSKGYGLKANDPSYKLKSGQTFLEQFTGKSVTAGFIPGTTFDAISGATITSKGVGSIITTASSAAAAYLASHTVPAVEGAVNENK